MKLKAITGIALTMLLLAVVSPIDVSVGVVDFDGESGDFAAQSGVDWWPMFRHDLSHTGYSTSTAPNTNNTIWTYPTGGAVYSSPAVADGRVYVGSYDRKVYCLNATTGAHIWNYTTGGDHSSPAVADGRVYVGSYGYAVLCLDALNGTLIWSYQTSNEVSSSPAVADGKVYVGSWDGGVYCLNATTGAYIWCYPTVAYVSSSPAVADGKVYVGSNDHKVYCLNASAASMYPSEREIWNYPTYSPLYSSPAVADGKVYVGSMDSIVNFYCLNASTGAHIWSYKTGGYVSSSPAVADGKVFVGSYDHKVYVFGPDTTPPNITDVSQFPFKNNVLPEDEVEVNATVTDDLSGVKQVTLNYTNGNGTWINVDMTNLEGNVWNATIPKFPYCTNVTYAIIAEDNANNTITTEETGYEYQYHVIPEFPSFIILPLFMLYTLIAVTLAKKIRRKVAKTT